MSQLADFLFYEEPGITLYCGDCRGVLPLLEAKSVDVVLADPPYNVGKKYGQHDDDMPQADYDDWLREALEAWCRVTRDAVVFFPGTRNALAIPALLPRGLTVHRLLGWHRKEFAGDKWTGGPAMSWEPIIWASRAVVPAFNRLYGSLGRDFLVVDATHGSQFAQEHPCPKPLRVMRWLVGLFAPPRGLVLDPTAGTGTTLEAAKDAGVEAIGIEIEPKYCEIAVKRLRQEVLPFRSISEPGTL